MSDSTTTVNFKQVGDDRYARIFDSLVLFADEMSFMDKSNADNLKNLITSDEISNRALFSNNIQMIKMNSTFIGASNKNLSQIFFDDSGMRRFVELHCLSKEKADWDAIKNIDYDAIWRCVNEFNDVNPINNVRNLIEELQEDMRAISPIEDWLRSFISNDEMDYVKRYNFKELYILFEVHREEYHSTYKSNASSFRNNLAALFQKPEYANITVKGKKGNMGATVYFVHDQVRKLAASYSEEEYSPAKFGPIGYRLKHPQYSYYIRVVEEEREAKLDAKLPASNVVVDLIKDHNNVLDNVSKEAGQVYMRMLVAEQKKGNQA